MTSNTELTLGQHLVQASIEKWKGYEEDEDEDDWKIRDEFLNCIVNELNSNCYYNSQTEKLDNEYIQPVLWNIFDVDYDIHRVFTILFIFFQFCYYEKLCGYLIS